MAFDLLSAEYGWTDEYIADRPLIRLRQTVAAIQRRKYLDSRTENSRYSWLARNLGVVVAGGYMVGEGEENPGIEFATSLAMDEIEREMLLETKKSIEETPAEDKNGVGSFESLMAAMGGSRAFQLSEGGDHDG